MRRTIPIAVLSLLSGFAQAQSTFDCSTFLNFAGNPAGTLTTFKQSPETMAWNWFVCLNQPVSAGNTQRVWEAFKPSEQVYQSEGQPPLPYAQREPVPARVLQLAQSQGMDPKGAFQNLGSDNDGSTDNGTQQVDGLVLQMGNQVPEAQRGQSVRFHLMMGQDTFNLIVDKELYNRNGIAALTSDLDFPATAWELKTAWLWIALDQAFKTTLSRDGYYITQAYYVDKKGQYQVGYAALSGMHVINKLTPDWVWTTFENVNNSKYTVTNDMPAKPMTNITGPTPLAQPVNASFQQQYPALGQYELIGVQFDQHQPQPKLLANSQMESAFQSHSSCLACHNTAAYSKQNSFFNFALPENDGIVYPTSVLPASDFVGYQKLDYVWSLKRAQWKR
ncbi:hypothetical protein [Pseudomonas sp. Fl4BN1]|uniref:hypothetical protein n=1 Tax=Pseudomonas sp. Fl4BN1 TaxID=2697651 RepID=UPI00137881DC|nr:hypothetical protein [Pseudomonas sp. Fl4BN1]NBF09269.1 hypothetical protein [Pseudomonas sp. Fl4BN1]